MGEVGIALLHAGRQRGEAPAYTYDAEHVRYSAEERSVYIGDAIVYPLSPGRHRMKSIQHLVRHSPTQIAEHLMMVRLIRLASSLESIARHPAWDAYHLRSHHVAGSRVRRMCPGDVR